jgi:hypothetical protein
MIYPYAQSTGIVCGNVIGIDVDLLQKEAASAAIKIIRDRFPGAIERYGRDPKGLFLFRAAQKFSGFKTKFHAPESSGLDVYDGMKKGGPLIEVLGAGSQFVAFGIHEDTKLAYRWPVGSPLEVRASELVEISEADATALVKDLIEMLDEQFGYKIASSKLGDVVQLDLSQVVPQEERFKQTEYHGAQGINQTILELPMKRHDEGIPCEETIKELRAIVLAAFNNIPDDDPAKETWDWRVQHLQIDDSVYGDIKKRCGEHPRLIEMLPNSMLEKWRAIEGRGGNPILYKKRGLGRGEWAVKDDGPAEEIPTMDAPPKEEPKSEEPKSDRALPRLNFIKAFDLASIPPRQWLFGRQYQRGVAAGTMAPGGRGKSSLVLVEAVSMGTVRKLLAEQPKERLRVWYHNGEETRDEIMRRLGAVCKHYSIPTSELEDWLCITTTQDFPLRVAEGGYELEKNKKLIAHVAAEIERNKFDVAIFDPLIALHGAPEKDNGLMRSVIDIFKDIAVEQDCAIEVVGHTRKPQGDRETIVLDVNDTRGASAITDALRSVRVLNVMTEREADATNIDPNTHTQYVRVDAAKRNYSGAAKADWVKIVNETLPNGDEVGVVTPWTHPGQEESSEKVTALFLRLLRRFNEQGHNLSSASNADNFAPKLFAATPEAKGEKPKISKEAFKKAMLDLIGAGKIRQEEVMGPNRHPRRTLVEVR